MESNNTTGRWKDCGDGISDIEAISQTIFLAVLLLANTIGNCTVCWVICHDERLRRQTRNKFIGSLAMSDLALVFNIAFRIVLLYDRNNEGVINSCGYFGTITVTLTYISILHVFLLSLDRYIAVMHPLRYGTIISDRFARISLAAVWLLPIVSMVFVPFLLGTTKQGFTFRGSTMGCSVAWEQSSKAHQLHFVFNATVFLAGPFAFMLVAYGRIIKVAWSQSTRVHPRLGQSQNASRATSAVTVTVTGPDESQSEAAKEQQRKEKRKRREMKWVKTVGLKNPGSGNEIGSPAGIVVGAFVVSFIPIFAAALVRVKLGPTVVPCWLFAVGILAMYANSALNPVIYSLRSREYRRAMWKVLGRRSPNRVGPTTGDEPSNRTNRLNTAAMSLNIEQSLF